MGVWVEGTVSGVLVAMLRWREGQLEGLCRADGRMGGWTGELEGLPLRFRPYGRMGR